MKNFINPWESQNPWAQGGAYHQLALDVPTVGTIDSSLRCICQTSLTDEIIIKTFDLENRLLLFDNYNMPSDYFSYNTPIADFRKMLNQVMESYQINNCHRKAHFIAQVWWETDRFNTLIEYGDGVGYNPGNHSEAIQNGHTQIGDGPKYKGRGCMQLTWKKNYHRYFRHRPESFQDVADLFEGTFNPIPFNPTNQANIMSIYKFKPWERVAASLFHALDSAGWFWATPIYLQRQKKYVYFNILSDEVNTNFVSRLVNGGGNGLVERREKTRILLQKFHASQCINRR